MTVHASSRRDFHQRFSPITDVDRRADAIYARRKADWEAAHPGGWYFGDDEEFFQLGRELVEADCNGVLASQVCTLAAGVYRKTSERRKIEDQMKAEGLIGVQLDTAIDLTLFARRFERWAEEGFRL